MAELGKVFKGPLDGCNEDEDSLVPTKWSFAAIPTVSGDRDELGNLKAQIASAKVSSVCQKLGKDPCDIGSTDGHGMTRESAPSETQNENQKHDDTPVDLGINDFQRKTYGWCF